jgi:hypothetical protein
VALAVNVADDPLQGLNVPDMLGTGFAFTVTLVEVDPVQPLLLVTVTV